MNHRELEERTFRLAQGIRAFVRDLPQTLATTIDGRELVKASGSVGSQCVSAGEAANRREFVRRIQIARKEAKKVQYWLRLLFLEEGESQELERERLLTECAELIEAFGKISDFDLRYLRF